HSYIATVFHLSISHLHFFFLSPGYHRDLHSFPTRRSSDLATSRCQRRELGDRDEVLARRDRLVVLAPQRPSGRPVPRHDREAPRSEEHTSELQSPDHLVCRLLLEKKKKNI